MRNRLLASAAMLGLAATPAFAGDNVASITQSGASQAATQDLAGSANLAFTTQGGTGNTAKVSIGQSPLMLDSKLLGPHQGPDGAMASNNKVYQNENGRRSRATATIGSGSNNLIHQDQSHGEGNREAAITYNGSSNNTIQQTQNTGSHNTSTVNAHGNGSKGSIVSYQTGGDHNVSSQTDYGTSSVLSISQDGSQNTATQIVGGGTGNQGYVTQNGFGNTAKQSLH